MANCPNCGKSYNQGDEVCQYCGLVFPFSTDVMAPGTILQGRYEIQELSHTGGMGYIYLAKDKKLYDRLCIVKQVKEPVKSDTDLKKLEEEARRMANLSHPNVAMILDHFVENNYYFLVVERIPGKTLSEIFEERHGRLTEDEVVGWAISICDVVSYIHKQGIIHRDISPDNIMLTEESLIKFVDFGTLRELRYITTRGTAGMGKYGYTPSEQWQGRPVPQSDIFALGASVYYLLSGFLPLSKEYLTGQGPQRADFSPSFPPIRTKNTSISLELEAVLQKALQLDVSNRYTSAAEFGQALRNLGKVAVPRREPVEAAKPVLSVDPDHLSFADVRIGSRATRTLTIRNTGTGRLTGKITTTQPWLGVSPSTIDLEKGEQEIMVIADACGLPSSFSGSGDISIVTNGGVAKVSVSLSTTAVTKPVRITRVAGHKRLALPLGIAFVILVALLIVAGRNIFHRTEAPSQKPPSPAVVTSQQAPPATTRKEADWPMRDRDTAFTRYTPDLPPDKLKVIWESKSVPKAALFLVSENKVLAVAVYQSGASTANLCCLDANNGTLLWQQSVSDEYWDASKSSVSQGKIFLGGKNNIHCLDATTGKKIWEIPVEEFNSLIPVDNKLIVATHYGVSCLDSLSGKTVWETANYFRISGVGEMIIEGDKIFAGHNMYWISCLDKDTGKILWQYEFPEHEHYSALRAANGKVFAVYGDIGGPKPQLLVCLDADSGKQIWRYAVDADCLNSPPAVGQGKLIICGKDTITCYDAATGKLVWQHQQEKIRARGGFCPIHGPIIAGNIVVTGWEGTDGCRTVYWDLNSGELTKELDEYLYMPVMAYGRYFCYYFESQDNYSLRCYGE